MDATALCCTLVTTASLLFVQIDFADSQHPDVVDFPQVFPNRQQHFQYESIRVSCEGLEGLSRWRVLKRINETVKPCATSLSASTGPCTIPTAFQKVNSGVYWCEMGGMKKSNTVNISITAGSVILESPVLPVMEGQDVTLSCRQKSASSSLTAEFFKDGVLLERSSTGSITLQSVTKDDEGVYRCRVSGAGASLESWLHVRRVRAREPQEPQASFHVMLPCHVVRGVGLIVLVLTLVVTLLLYRKRKAATRAPTSPSPAWSSISPP